MLLRSGGATNRGRGWREGRVISFLISNSTSSVAGQEPGTYPSKDHNHEGGAARSSGGAGRDRRAPPGHQQGEGNGP